MDKKLKLIKDVTELHFLLLRRPFSILREIQYRQKLAELLELVGIDPNESNIDIVCNL